MDEFIEYKYIQFIPCDLTFWALIKSHKLNPHNVQFAKFFKRITEGRRDLWGTIPIWRITTMSS